MMACVCATSSCGDGTRAICLLACAGENETLWGGFGSYRPVQPEPHQSSVNENLRKKRCTSWANRAQHQLCAVISAKYAGTSLMYKIQQVHHQTEHKRNHYIFSGGCCTMFLSQKTGCPTLRILPLPRSALWTAHTHPAGDLQRVGRRRRLQLRRVDRRRRRQVHRGLAAEHCGGEAQYRGYVHIEEQRRGIVFLGQRPRKRKSR